MNNSIFVISPYLYDDCWVFDDESVGLFREPFVAGADTFLDFVSKGKSEIIAMFSTIKFPDYDFSLSKLYGDATVGTTYQVDNYSINGKLHEMWLCPALNLYFPTSPEKIFIKIK